MKCTIRKVNEGIIATVDERPKLLEPFYDTSFKAANLKGSRYEFFYPDCHKILASTFGVGMELWLDHESSFMPFHHYYKKTQNLMIGKEYEYRIESEKLIITL